MLKKYKQCRNVLRFKKEFAIKYARDAFLVLGRSI